MRCGRNLCVYRLVSLHIQKKAQKHCSLWRLENIRVANDPRITFASLLRFEATMAKKDHHQTFNPLCHDTSIRASSASWLSATVKRLHIIYIYMIYIYIYIICKTNTTRVLVIRQQRKKNVPVKQVLGIKQYMSGAKEIVAIWFQYSK